MTILLVFVSGLCKHSNWLQTGFSLFEPETDNPVLVSVHVQIGLLSVFTLKCYWDPYVQISNKDLISILVTKYTVWSVCK